MLLKHDKVKVWYFSKSFSNDIVLLIFYVYCANCPIYPKPFSNLQNKEKQTLCSIYVQSSN
jgi:hypothetical protein